MKTDGEILDDLIRREGDKYTNHPADRGGPTKFGITLKTLETYRARQHPGAVTTAKDVEQLTEAEARAIYRQVFVVDPGFDRIFHTALRALIVDAGVQHGPDDATRFVQAALDLKVDGIFGPITRKAVNLADVRGLFAEVVALRNSYYGKLVTEDPAAKRAKDLGIRLQAENAHGWNNRVGEFIREIAML